jgi:flavin reductase (DIM6/NTAB) family NADH-FMN oxidoreductase RutF
LPKVEVAFDRFLPQIMRSLNSGALLVSLDAAGRPNAMTIGWGTLGIIWSRPIFVAAVRPQRYTYGCIEATDDFTVCIPYPGMAEAVMFCGTESGRSHDKFEECGFTAVAAQGTKSPGIVECGLVLECRVVHKNDIVPAQLNPDISEQMYPGRDFHRFYYGEVLRTVADEDFEARFGAG